MTDLYWIEFGNGNWLSGRKKIKIGRVLVGGVQGGISAG